MIPIRLITPKGNESARLDRLINESNDPIEPATGFDNRAILVSKIPAVGEYIAFRNDYYEVTGVVVVGAGAESGAKDHQAVIYAREWVNHLAVQALEGSITG